jgi:uncharacterized protein (DUF488 family)
MAPPFYTIGHSNRNLEEFTALLTDAGIEVLVDVRTVPRSRANPQFNQTSLPEDLARFKIEYTRMEALGGLRSKSKTVERDVNGFWENASFHNYADHALTEDFDRGLRELIELGHKRPCAIMCSEAVWWRCHRRIIADHLIARGEEVFHIMGLGRLTPASLTPGAVVEDSGKVVYPDAPNQPIRKK